MAVKSRVIIENRTELPDHFAMRYAMTVMEQGRISGSGDRAQYCYHTSFENGVHVSAFKNKASDRLVVHYNDGARND